jgi:hypothetical protein
MAVSRDDAQREKGNSLSVKYCSILRHISNQRLKEDSTVTNSAKTGGTARGTASSGGTRQTHSSTTGSVRQADSSVRGIGPSQTPLHDNTHNRQTSMPQAGFEPATPGSAPPQTHSFDQAANGIGRHIK